MSFCLRPNVCKKCGKPLTLFEGWTCFECEKVEQEVILDKIRAEIESKKAEYEKELMPYEADVLAWVLNVIDKYTGVKSDGDI